MAIIKHTHGNLNDIRSYPFADTANLRTDAGAIMPQSILNDCHIWWPDTYGDIGYISAATVSPALITFVVSAYNVNTAAATVIGVVEIKRPGTAYRSYPVTGIQVGVSGWLAFGTIPKEMTGVNSWIFDTYTNAELVRKVAQSYPVCPIRSISRLDAPTTLDGTVKFIGGSNLTIEEGYRNVDGALTRCIVFALNDDKLPELYEYFAGDCGKRPESVTCDDKPINTINGVVPDCDGVITLDIHTTAGNVLYALPDVPTGLAAHGAALRTIVEYTDICYTPDPNPLLPDDACDSSLSAQLLSSSSFVPMLSSSSSSGSIPTITYSFNSPTDLRDWSLFADNGSHRPAWDSNNNAVFYPPKWRSNRRLMLNLPMLDGSSEDVGELIRNNAYRAEFPASLVAGEEVWAELEVEIGLDINELRSVGCPILVYLAICDEKHQDTTAYGARLVIEYTGMQVSADVTKVTIWYEENDAAGWTQIGSDQVYWRDWAGTFLSSSTADPCTSSSSTCLSQIIDRIRFRINWGYSSGAAVLSSPTWQYNDDLQYAPGVVSTPSQAILNAEFFDITVKCSATPSIQLGIDIREAILSSPSLTHQQCDDLDATPATIRSDVDFLVKYDPATTGWMTDFSTKRAENQWEFSSPNAFAFPTFGTNDDHTINTGRQYMESTRHDHAFAILGCEPNSAWTGTDGYVFSAVFKALWGTTDPRFGIVLGYNSRLQLPGYLPYYDVFWMPWVDPLNKKYGYAVHQRKRGGHTIDWGTEYNLADKIPECTDVTWANSWHRLVARMSTSGSTHTLQFWIDPFNAGSSSSSGQQSFTKEISYKSTAVVRAFGRSEYNGDVPDINDFTDGSPGIYTLGRVRATGFTVSKYVDAEIVVPNKLPWLWDT